MYLKQLLFKSDLKFLTRGVVWEMALKQLLYNKHAEVWCAFAFETNLIGKVIGNPDRPHDSAQRETWSTCFY